MIFRIFWMPGLELHRRLHRLLTPFLNRQISMNIEWNRLFNHTTFLSSLAVAVHSLASSFLSASTLGLGSGDRGSTFFSVLPSTHSRSFSGSTLPTTVSLLEQLCPLTSSTPFKNRGLSWSVIAHFSTPNSSKKRDKIRHSPTKVLRERHTLWEQSSQCIPTLSATVMAPEPAPAQFLCSSNNDNDSINKQRSETETSIEETKKKKKKMTDLGGHGLRRRGGLSVSVLDLVGGV